MHVQTTDLHFWKSYNINSKKMILPTFSFCIISTPYSTCDFDFSLKTNRQTSRDASLSNIDQYAQVVQIEQCSKLGQAPLRL